MIFGIFQFSENRISASECQSLVSKDISEHVDSAIRAR